MSRTDLGMAGALGILAALAPARVEAAPTCGSLAEFNAYMADNATSTADVTLTYDLVGVNPSDFHNSKGSLAQMRNTACAAGQDATIKVYGTADVYNAAHPPGTLKLEYGNQCCNGVCGEKWADPNASAEIFADGTEACNVTMWLKPDSVGYKLVCPGGTFEALGDNADMNTVNQIAVLEYLLGDGGKTWELPKASATNVEVCYEATPSSSETLTVPVAEDVTSGPTHLDTVFPDVTDLAVEAADNEAYLKFVVPPIAGKITKVVLAMHTRPESYSAGDGGEVYLATSNDWSESTMTWNTRPPRTMTSLGRIGPAAEDQSVSLELSAAIAGEGTYSFVVVSPPTDTNGTHFYSKEGSPASAPSLKIGYEVVDGDGDGTPDGPDCNDGDPAVHPGAVEQCNGVDDDCDGQMDEGCGGGGGDGGSGASSGAGGGGASGPGQADNGGLHGGCGCSLPQRGDGWLPLALAVLLLGARPSGPAAARPRKVAATVWN